MAPASPVVVMLFAKVDVTPFWFKVSVTLVRVALPDASVLIGAFE